MDGSAKQAATLNPIRLRSTIFQSFGPKAPDTTARHEKSPARPTPPAPQEKKSCAPVSRPPPSRKKSPVRLSSSSFFFVLDDDAPALPTRVTLLIGCNGQTLALGSIWICPQAKGLQSVGVGLVENVGAQAHRLAWPRQLVPYLASEAVPSPSPAP